jgi:peroxiredoxin
MYKTGSLSVILLLVLLTCIISCSGGSTEVYEVDGVYSFSLTGLNGDTKNFADLRGKGVMLNAWATWCAPCLDEIPIFTRLYDKYKDKGLEIWGVSTDIEGKSVVVPKAEELGINYPVLLSKSSELARILGVSFRGLPVTIFFDPQGRISYTHIGSAEAYLDEEAGETLESWFEKKIVAILP